MFDAEGQRARVVMIAVAVATLVAYVPVLSASFINYDDLDYITKNPVVPGGLTVHGLGWAFTTGHMANWHPLAWVSHMIDASLFGLNPTGHHLTSVLLHAVNTWLVARFVFEATGARWRSLIVAALFGLHPLHVESVAWVSERKDVLCALFWLSASIVWVRWTKRRARLDYAATVLLFACALASKPMAVTFPFALLLFDVWPLERSKVIGARRALVEKAPLFLLSVLSSVVTYVVQRNGGAMDVDEPMVLRARVANAFVAYARYVGKTLVPVDLAIIYPHPVGGWPPWVVGAAVLGFIAVSVVCVRRLAKQPWLFVGWAFFLGVLAPTIGIVQVGAQSMADRYTYLPSLGLFLAGVWTAGDYLARRNNVTTPVVAVTGLVMAMYAALTYRQAGYFKDGVTVFRHAIAVTSPNVVANARLGSALSKEGRFDEAERAYRAALAIAPASAANHAELGGLLVHMRRLDEAIAQDQEAIRLQPNLAMAHYNLGLALLKRHELAPALAHLELAVKISPKSPESHTGFGLGLSEAGRLDDAMAELQTAIRLSPHGTLDARNGLAIALVRAGRLGEALAMFQTIVAADPSQPLAHANLGNALVDSGRVDEGIAELSLAVRLEPGNAMSHYGLASALLGRGRVGEAVAEYRESLRIDPTNEDVQRELASALKGAR